MAHWNNTKNRNFRGGPRIALLRSHSSLCNDPPWQRDLEIGYCVTPAPATIKTPAPLLHLSTLTITIKDHPQPPMVPSSQHATAEGPGSKGQTCSQIILTGEDSRGEACISFPTIHHSVRCLFT